MDSQVRQAAQSLSELCQFNFGRSYGRLYRRPAGAITLGIIFGCIDEMWQSLIPGRNPSYYDVIADGIGVILGVITIRMIKKQFK